MRKSGVQTKVILGVRRQFGHGREDPVSREGQEARGGEREVWGARGLGELLRHLHQEAGGVSP